MEDDDDNLRFTFVFTYSIQPNPTLHLNTRTMYLNPGACAMLSVVLLPLGFRDMALVSRFRVG